ncbi:IS3 family transposase [Allocoprobacillus halotolerans]|uniref:IS3 family transposase n=1 Tax=Allocoprobacillus halotolerans TaxID=2944914 RepID=UPI00338F056F
MTKKVEEIYRNSHEIYGSPKITEMLNQNGEKVSQRYIYSIMRENSWKARYVKPWK